MIYDRVIYLYLYIEYMQVFETVDKPYGKTWEEWVIKWWEWFLGTPYDKHPARGHDMSIGQNDPNVYFLMGGTGGGFQRDDLVVPFGKSLFLPVINYIGSYAEENISTESELLEFTNKHLNDMISKHITVDGENVNFNRIYTTPFDISYGPDNIFDVKPGLTRAASDGYWVFLYPMSRGEHDIQIRSSCSSGRNAFSADLHLTVQ